MKENEILTLVDTIDALDDHYFDAKNIWLFDDAIPAQSIQMIAERAQHWIALESGEALKSLPSISSLSEKILALRHSRPLRLIAVGGGALGDAIGFLASILWRGVQLIHVPTTLLAMIDSSIGGKTAINLDSIKNQLGSFYRAQEIIFVKEIIESLPEKLKREGRAEMIKSAWLDGEHSINQIAKLEKTPNVEEWSAAITRVAAFKKRIVALDPFDNKDIRIQLNFGHSVAHGIERLLGLSHGESVAWGLMSAALLGRQHGLSQLHSRSLFEQASKIVRPHGGILHLDPNEFIGALKGDKKRKKGHFRSVIVSAPGQFEIREDISELEWFDALQNAYSILSEPRLLDFTHHERKIQIRPPLSKSEHIRILSFGTSHSGVDNDDTFFAQRMFSETASPRYVGEGATGFRFLAIREAFAPKAEGVTFELAESLMKRNHRELWDLFEKQDVPYSIDHCKESRTRRVSLKGKKVKTLHVAIAKQNTSHIASGLALLAAQGIAITIEWEEIASFPYFEMTLKLLKKAGVRIDINMTGRRVSLHPTPDIRIPEIDMDAGAYAFWKILGARGVKVEIQGSVENRWQPDFNIDTILSTLDENESATIDLNASPDLAPVLGAFAAVEGKKLQIVGAQHLRNKESNRIEDLLDMLQSVGVKCESRHDGFVIDGKGSILRSGSVDCKGDHRLVMAAAILATGVTLELKDPMCVSKSYWNFWHDLREAGFRDMIQFRD